MKKMRTLLVFGVGFLFGSKAGHKPYDKFKVVMRRIRQSRPVAAPIEAVAHKASGLVRDTGFSFSERAADVTYRTIVGGEPVTIEAHIVEDRVLEDPEK